MANKNSVSIEVMALVEDEGFIFQPAAGEEAREQAKRINDAAQAISSILTDSGHLIVFAPGEEAGQGTARALLQHKWIQEHSLLQERMLITSGCLSKEINSYSRQDQRPLLFKAEMLGIGTNMILDRAQSTAHLGMMIVAGPEIVERIPTFMGAEYKEPVDTDPLAINHFSLEVPAKS